MEKSVDGVLGIQTHSHMMVGADETMELLLHLLMKSPMLTSSSCEWNIKSETLIFVQIWLFLKQGSVNLQEPHYLVNTTLI